LGGITVLFFLPASISIFHGVLAQIFLILTIIIAYSLSDERCRRENCLDRELMRSGFLKLNLFLVIVVFFQLILGAIMRHTESGLAIADFPKMGGYWFPPFNRAMLAHINGWRFENNFDPVTMAQVIYHFLHRLGAVVVAAVYVWLRLAGRKHFNGHRPVSRAFLCLDFLLILQLFLGAVTVLTMKSPWITSLHVVFGAAILGTAVLLFLRAAPLSWDQWTRPVNILKGL
jgi:cytochrome c oxidase assembly protein subunit 15